LSTSTTALLAASVPSSTAGETAGPPGQVVMVTGCEMVMWSSILPETLMVAPEAALVRAKLTVEQGLVDVQVPLSNPPCHTYKASGAAAWGAAGAKAPKASTTAPAPSVVAAYRPACPRIRTIACVFMETPPGLTLPKACTVRVAPHSC